MELNSINSSADIEFAIKWAKRITNPAISFNIRSRMCRHARSICLPGSTSHHLLSQNIYIQAIGQTLCCNVARRDCVLVKNLLL